MAPMGLLEGRNLRKTYRLGRRNTIEALRGVDVRIEPGEMVAIMGPSGSGKSTLMHILGLLHAPDVNHGPRPELSLRRAGHGGPRRGRADPHPGPPDGLRLPGLQPGPDADRPENVTLACDYAGIRGSAARQAAREALDLVGLADRGDHRPAELSGGEQQRVAIARALANRPSLILADEPTGNLDSERSSEVLALLRRFNREHGQTFVLVTHDAEVGEACDRVVRMRDGRIRDQASAALPGPVVSTPRAVAAWA